MRKVWNSSSRSPSPPGNKEKLQEVLTETSKLQTLSGLKENAQKDVQVVDSTPGKSKMKPNKDEKRVIDVAEKVADQDSDEGRRNGYLTQFPLNLRTNACEEAKAEDAECKIEGAPGEVIKAEEAIGNAESGDDECKIKDDNEVREVPEQKFEESIKVKKESLSATEAALIIESAYRGFEVRRWEPLKKLKQIATVREQVVEVRNRIQALESSDVAMDNKENMAIGETIMNLLLKLDAVQGLHPVIRDIRKSVARELISLQEKLDSLMIKEPEGSIKEISAGKPIGDSCGCPNDDASMEEGQNKEVGNFSSESKFGNSFCLVEPCQDHPSDMTDVGSHGEETSETLLVNNGPRELANPITGRSGIGGMEHKLAKQEPFLNAEREENSTGLDAGFVAMMGIQEGDHEPFSELEHSTELPLTTGEISSEVELTSSSKDLASDLHGNKFGADAVDVSTPADKALEEHQLAEGVIDEEPEQMESEKKELLVNGELLCNVVNNMMPSDEEALAMNQLEQKQEEEFAEGGNVMTQLEDHVEVGSDKFEELLVVTGLGDLLDQPQREEVSYESQLVETSQPEEPQPVSPLADKENHNVGPKEKQEKYGTDYTLPSASESTVDPSEEKEMPIEESKEDNVNKSVAMGVEEDELLEKKAESQESDSVFGEDEMVVWSNGCQTTEENVDWPAAIAEERVESQELESVISNNEMVMQLSKSEPMEPTKVFVGAKAGEEEMDAFPVLSTVNNVPLAESTDNKLIEENKKMREMMEKLMEAGKEQLTVISNLTGRVKDLERELSRKKLRKRPHRAAVPRSSCATVLKQFQEREG